MPRTARPQSGTGIYHVMLRGVNRQDIFEEEEDYWKMIAFLAILQHRDTLQGSLGTSQGTGSCCPAQVPVPEGVPKAAEVCAHIYAYCLMPNHIHLLIREMDWSLADCIKLLADHYVKYYNKKYGRTGHLFQDRYKSEPCNDMAYFTVLLRYIHQNPVKAGICIKPVEYDYSSWPNDYLGLSPTKVCQTEVVLRRLTMKQLYDLINEPLSEEYQPIDISERRVISDTEIRDIVLQKRNLRTITDFQLLSLDKRKETIREVMLAMDSVSVGQLSRVTGMNYATIRNIAKTL